MRYSSRGKTEALLTIEAEQSGGQRDRQRSSRRRRTREDEPPPKPKTPQMERWLQGLLIAIVVGSVLAIGAVHVPVLLIVAAAAFAALGLAMLLRVAPSLSLPLSAPVLIASALALWTLAQAVTLPLSWAEAISPQNADVWTRAYALIGEAAPGASISLDPGASFIEVTKWLVYAAVFAAATAVASRRGAAWGVTVVFASAVVAALTTVGHGLVGATRVFGIYEPSFQPATWHVGPLLNPNNLAGYLNLGALCGIGAMLMRKPVLPTWLTAIGLSAIVGVEIVSASRGGVLALPIGVVLVAILMQRRTPRADTASNRVRWALAAVLGSGVLLALLGGTSTVWSELYSQNIEKTEMAGWVSPLVVQHAWLGVGRGAFESVFPAYSLTPGNIVYTHAENFVVQWAAEWGIPVTVAAFAALGWALRPSRLGVRRSALATGAWVGVLVLLLQNLVDLALEVPAVCIAVAATLGSLWGDPDRGRSGRRTILDRPVSTRGAQLAAAVCVAVGALSLFATATIGRRDIAADRASVRARFESADWASADARKALRGEVSAAMVRHPADPYFPLVGALAAWKTQGEDPMPWLQRTLERAPINGRAHLLLAEVLNARGGLHQALFELRLAQESDPRLAQTAGPMATRWTDRYEELLLAVPEGWQGAATLDAMASALHAPSAREIRTRCDLAAIARDPSRLGPHQRLAGELLVALESGSKSDRCDDRTSCESEIEAHAEAIGLARPETSIAAQLRATLLLVRGDPVRAEAMLKTGCENVTDRVACLMVKARAAAEIPGEEKLGAVEKELRSAACVTHPDCAMANAYLGDLRLKRGEKRAAVTNYERAAIEDPSEARLLRLADAAESAGEHARTVDALEKVAQKRGHADAALQARIDEAKRRALAGFIRP